MKNNKFFLWLIPLFFLSLPLSAAQLEPIEVNLRGYAAQTFKNVIIINYAITTSGTQRGYQEVFNVSKSSPGPIELKAAQGGDAKNIYILSVSANGVGEFSMGTYQVNCKILFNPSKGMGDSKAKIDLSVSTGQADAECAITPLL